jgi:hypothetical protein
MVRNRLFVGMICLCLACGGDAPASEGDPGMEAVAGEIGVVDVTARGLTFDAPSEIPAGWTTFRFTNASPMVHFVAVQRMPEGYGVREQQGEVAPIFQDGLDLLTAGDVDGAMAEFGKIPAWFGEIVLMGGPGLTSPGLTSGATVYLEPGTYLLECYVKTDGVFHSFNPDPAAYGMVHEFTVTGEMSTAVEPMADLDVTISSEGGITMEGDPAPGPQTIRVRFADQTLHENFGGNDVHVVRLSQDLDLGALDLWMDWRQPGGLQSPAPANFVGGLNDMPAGETGYFSVTLAPGEYALISEVAGAMGKGLFRAFTVDSVLQ